MIAAHLDGWDLSARSTSSCRSRTSATSSARPPTTSARTRAAHPSASPRAEDQAGRSTPSCSTPPTSSSSPRPTSAGSRGMGSRRRPGRDARPVNPTARSDRRTSARAGRRSHGAARPAPHPYDAAPTHHNCRRHRDIRALVPRRRVRRQHHVVPQRRRAQSVVDLIVDFGPGGRSAHRSLGMETRQPWRRSSSGLRHREARARSTSSCTRASVIEGPNGTGPDATCSPAVR